jgi:hypothetical protein
MSSRGAGPALALLAILAILAILGWACGAATSPGAGELMFDFAADEEDAGVDSGRRPLALDGGP